MAAVNENSNKGRNSDTDIIKKMFLLELKSVKEIASKLNIPEDRVEKVVKYLKQPKRSKGEVKMYDILLRIYPFHKILEQEPIEHLFFDFYIPKLRLAIEYDGSQHFEYNSHFFGEGYKGQFNFEYRQQNDSLKNKLAKQKHIYVLRVSYKETLSVDNIRRIINEHTDKIVANLAEYNASFRVKPQDV